MTRPTDAEAPQQKSAADPEAAESALLPARDLGGPGISRAEDDEPPTPSLSWWVSSVGVRIGLVAVIKAYRPDFNAAFFASDGGLWERTPASAKVVEARDRGSRTRIASSPGEGAPPIVGYRSPNFGNPVGVIERSTAGNRVRQSSGQEAIRTGITGSAATAEHPARAPQHRRHHPSRLIAPE
jgi:hypothetical protein